MQKYRNHTWSGLLILIFLASCTSADYLKKADLPEADDVVAAGGKKGTKKKGPRVTAAQIEKETKKKWDKKPAILIEPKPTEQNEPSKKEKKNLKEDKKNKPCYYWANVITREKIGKKKKAKFITSLAGNAKVKCDTTILESKRINIHGKRGKNIRLKNYVKITDTENNTVITGGYGEYFKNYRFARLLDKPKIVHTNPKTGVQTVITCFVVRRNFRRKFSNCKGNVEIRRDGWYAKAEQAFYYEATQRVILKGNPIIRHENDYYSATEVHLQNPIKKKEGFVLLKQNARIVTIQDQKNESAPDPKTGTPKKNPSDPKQKNIPIIITAESIKRYTTKNKERAIILAGENSKAKVYRLGTEILADRVQTTGAQNEFIQAYDDVSIWDPEQSLLIVGPYLEYDKLKDWGRMTQNPEVYMIHSEAERVGALIQASELERLFDQNLIQFKGQVKLSHFDINKDQVEILEDGTLTKAQYYSWEVEDSYRKFINAKEALQVYYIFLFDPPVEPLQAVAEYGIYNENSEILELEGDAAVRQGSHQISSQKILFHPRSGRIQLAGGVSGWLLQQ